MSRGTASWPRASVALLVCTLATRAAAAAADADLAATTAPRSHTSVLPVPIEQRGWRGVLVPALRDDPVEDECALAVQHQYNCSKPGCEDLVAGAFPPSEMLWRTLFAARLQSRGRPSCRLHDSF